MKHSGRFAYLLVTRGTKESEKIQTSRQFVAGWGKFFLGRMVETASLTSSRSTISKAIDALVERGAQEICLLPFARLRDRQAKQDIPAEVQAAKRRFPEVDFHYAFIQYH